MFLKTTNLFYLSHPIEVSIKNLKFKISILNIFLPRLPLFQDFLLWLALEPSDHRRDMPVISGYCSHWLWRLCHWHCSLLLRTPALRSSPSVQTQCLLECFQNLLPLSPSLSYVVSFVPLPESTLCCVLCVSLHVVSSVPHCLKIFKELTQSRGVGPQ